MTITSSIVMLGFVDFGIGSGLINEISAAHGRGEKRTPSKLVSTAFFLQVLIATILVVVFLVFYGYINWGAIYNIKTSSVASLAGPATAAVVICTAVNMPISIVQRVQAGYQEAYNSNIWAAVGSGLTIVAVILATKWKLSLVAIVAVVTAAPIFATLGSWYPLFIVKRPWLLPRLEQISKEASISLTRTGAAFVILQICGIVGLMADNLIIAHIIGVDEVTKYSVVQRLFLGTMIAQLFVSGFTPAFGESLARGDYIWANNALKKTLLGSTMLGIATALPLVIFGNEVIRWWVPGLGSCSPYLLLGFGLYVITSSYGCALTSFIHCGPLVRTQIPYQISATVAVIVLKILGCWMYGSMALPLAGFVGYLMFSLIPLTNLAFKSLKIGSAPIRVHT